jgi:hypothetical protein
MWYPLGLFGSCSVEAATVSVGATGDDVDRGAGNSNDLLESPPSTPSAGARMEGNDVTTLIAARMGIDPKDVTSRLVSLHQKKELDGAAVDGAAAGGPVEGDEKADVSLTIGDLEEFERSEAADVALVPAAATTSTGVKLTLKPAVLGAPASATPSATKSTTQSGSAAAAAARATPSATISAIKTPTKAATDALEDEPVTMDLTDSPPLVFH